MELDDSDKALLLRIARGSIEAAIRGDRIPDFRTQGPMHAGLEREAGAFVTLEVGKDLRGCVGFIEGVGALWETVSQAAVSAALHDTRFPPLREEELAAVEIEISVLSPLRVPPSIDDITVGEHGILIQCGFHHGLLLPQVAVEHRWDRTVFLEQTCVKAGLPKDAWRWKDTVLHIFSATIFNESSVSQ